MTKRPDQYQIDQNEAQATDYKFRRQTEDSNRRDQPENETLEGGRGNPMTPRDTMNARTSQSAKDREAELERAAGVRERGEGNHPSSSDEAEPEGDRSALRADAVDDKAGSDMDRGSGTDEQLDRKEIRSRGSAGGDH